MDYYCQWLDETKGTFVHAKKKMKITLFIAKIVKAISNFQENKTAEDIITLHLVGGKLVKPNLKSKGN